jgi:hypothetical protein
MFKLKQDNASSFTCLVNVMVERSRYKKLCA